MTVNSGHSGMWELVYGGSAGLAVDIGLYPIDTIKTRLQSREGFMASGGFRKIYSGMSSVMVGSAPGAAVFFLTYRQTQQLIGSHTALSNGVSASVAEVAACLIRVPTELIKQRAQAAHGKLSVSAVVREVLRMDGFQGFYRGFGSTLIREIPFSFIQMPIWEFLKKTVSKKQNRPCNSTEAALCGSIAGCISAATTTPLDVAKTRIMLSRDKNPLNVVGTLRQVYAEGGVNALFSGIVPRTFWISVGGFVFFGAYETVKQGFESLIPN